MALLGVMLLHPLSRQITAIYLLALAALQFGMPLWLLNLQSLKKWVGRIGSAVGAAESDLTS
jgi:hypothetical protein